MRQIFFVVFGRLIIRGWLMLKPLRLLVALIGLAATSSVNAAEFLHFSGSNLLYLQQDAEALFGAVVGGDTDAAMHYLEWGVPVDVKSVFEYPPLVVAVWEDNLCMAKLLVGAGASVCGKPDFMQRSALFWAAMSGNLEIVMFLLEEGAAACDKPGMHLEPLLMAVGWGGDVDVARLLIEHGWEVRDSEDGLSGVTPLKAAASNVHTEVVEFFLEHGASVDTVDCRGDTPLHAAVSGSNYDGHHAEIARLLLKHGADIGAVNKRGQTPFVVAVISYSYFEGEVIDLLLEQGHGLLSQDTMDQWGDEMMRKAMNSSLLGVVQFLLDYGYGAGADSLDERGDAVEWGVVYLDVIAGWVDRMMKIALGYR